MVIGHAVYLVSGQQLFQLTMHALNKIIYGLQETGRNIFLFKSVIKTEIVVTSVAEEIHINVRVIMYILNLFIFYY